MFWQPGKILLVINNELIRKQTSELLKNAGHKVIEAKDGAKALWHIADHQQIDLVISELVMPILDGPGLIKAINQAKSTKKPPVILIGNKQQKDKIMEGLMAGAQDFVQQPFEAQDLLLRIKNCLIISRTTHTLSILSQTDELTGIYNRRYFLKELDKEIDRAHRTANALGVIFTELDDFEKLQNRSGKRMAEQLLKIFAQKILDQIRPYDLLARYQGSEFAIISPSLDEQGLVAQAERIRIDMTKEIKTLSQSFKMSISLGIAIFDPLHKEKPFEFLSRAEGALIKAKDQGGNQTILAPQLT